MCEFLIDAQNGGPFLCNDPFKLANTKNILACEQGMMLSREIGPALKVT